jgi:hypothetical protein
MLGLVETKRHSWFMARHHLGAAIKRYLQLGEDLLALHARHALAYVPYVEEDFASALSQLQEVLGEAEHLPAGPARDQLVELLVQDTAKTRDKIDRPIPPDG